MNALVILFYFECLEEHSSTFQKFDFNQSLESCVLHLQLQWSESAKPGIWGSNIPWMILQSER